MELAIHYGEGVQGRQGKGRGTGGKRGKCGRVEEMEKNYATMLNIVQSKNVLKGGSQKRKGGVEPGNTRYGRREIWIPCPPTLVA